MGYLLEYLVVEWHRQELRIHRVRNRRCLSLITDGSVRQVVRGVHALDEARCQ